MKNQIVSFCCIRRCEAQQWENWHDDLIGNRMPASAFLSETLPESLSSYSWYELVTTGWKSGRYTRVKKLTAEKALTYINKLHAGSWIDRETYDVMYSATNALLAKHREGPWIPTKESEANLEFLEEMYRDVYTFRPCEQRE